MLDNKTEQKWPLAKEAKAEFVKGHFFFVLLDTQAKNAGGVASSAHRHYFAAGEKPRSIKQRSCGGKFPITTAAVFLRNEKILFFHGTGRKKEAQSGRSSDLCLNRWACQPSRNHPMTDFRHGRPSRHLQRRQRGESHPVLLFSPITNTATRPPDLVFCSVKSISQRVGFVNPVFKKPTARCHWHRAAKAHSYSAEIR